MILPSHRSGELFCCGTNYFPKVIFYLCALSLEKTLKIRFKSNMIEITISHSVTDSILMGIFNIAVKMSKLHKRIHNVITFYCSNHFSQLRAFCQQSLDRGLHDRQQLGLSVRGGRRRQGRLGRRRLAVLESGFPAGFALQQPKSGCSAFVRTRYLKLHF
jgi:hypothetical protein